MSEVALQAYNNTFLIHLRGDLKRHALLQSLQELVDRHDALRTSFDLSEPKQYVAASIRIEIPIADLTQRTQPDQEAEVVAAVQSESCQAFDVTKAPLLRARLVKLSPSHHVLPRRARTGQDVFDRKLVSSFRPSRVWPRNFGKKKGRRVFRY